MTLTSIMGLLKNKNLCITLKWGSVSKNWSILQN
jgi:hypothetical protein